MKPTPTRFCLTRGLKRFSRAAFVLGILASLAPVHAADIFKADNLDDLNLPNSWDGGVVPSSSDIAVWDNRVGTAVPQTLLLGADANWSGILIFDPAGAVSIGAGNTLTLGAAGIDTSGGSQTLTLANPVVIGAPQTWSLVTAVTVSGVISGDAGNSVTLNNAGQLNISAANNAFVEGITVEAGVLNVTAGSSMPVRLNGGQFLVGAALGNPVDVMVNGGTIRLTANRTLSGAFTGSGTATAVINSGSTTLSFGGNVFSGFSGTLSMGTSPGGFRPNSGAFAGSDAMTLDLGSSSGYLTRNNSAARVHFGALAGGPATQLRGGGMTYVIGALNTDHTFSGDIQNSSIVKIGQGMWTLDGASTFAGSTTISNGVVQIGAGTTTGSLGTGSVTNHSGLVFNRDGVLTFANPIHGSGGVTNIGPGRVVLSGASTYDGPTHIASGTLAVGSASTAAGDYIVASGASIGAALTSAGGTVTKGNISFDAGSAYEFDLGSFGNPAAPVATNTGTITLNGNVTVNVTGSDLTSGTITLLRYANRAGAGSFVLGSLPPNVDLVSFSDDTVNKRVTVTINVGIVVDETLRWVGNTQGIWDIDNPANSVWRVVGTGQTTNYYDGADVRFDDSATGSTNINLVALLAPKSIVVSNAAKTYTFHGDGSLYADTAVLKEGSGTLVVSNANTYTGVTTIEGGTIRVVGEVGAIGVGGVTNNGALIIDRTDASILLPHTTAFFGQIAGTGSLTYLGVDSANSILELEIGEPSGNPYSGGTTISNGYVRLNANPSSDATRSAAKSTGLGSGTITLLGESILELEDYGVGNNSAQAGTFSAPLHLGAGQTAEFRAPGRYNLASPLTGSGTLNLVVANVRGNVSGDWTAFDGQINIRTFDGADDFRVASAAGFPLARLNLTAGAIMYSRAGGNAVIPVGELTGEAGSQIDAGLSGGGESGQAVTWRVGGLNTDAAFAGDIANGAAAVSLIKEGTGTWTLSGANLSYSGSTTISNGVLAVASESGITNSSIIRVAAPGVLNATGLPDGTLRIGADTASQTLTGDGTIQGNLFAGALASVAPGFAGGTLTVSGAVTLGGSTMMELNRDGAPNSDRIASSSITAGGDLVVTNIGVALQAGDTFQLFSTPVLGSFASVTLPATDANNVSYTWTDRLAVDGTIVVATVAGGVNPNPTNLVVSASSGSLSLQWPESHTGWILQTNAAGLNAFDQWHALPGSTQTNRVDLTIDRAQTNVFYRLVLPAP